MCRRAVRIPVLKSGPTLRSDVAGPCFVFVLCARWTDGRRHCAEAGYTRTAGLFGEEVTKHADSTILTVFSGAHGECFQC